MNVVKQFYVFFKVFHLSSHGDTLFTPVRPCLPAGRRHTGAGRVDLKGRDFIVLIILILWTCCGDSSALSVTFQLFGFCDITKEQRSLLNRINRSVLSYFWTQINTSPDVRWVSINPVQQTIWDLFNSWTLYKRDKSKSMEKWWLRRPLDHKNTRLDYRIWGIYYVDGT